MTREQFITTIRLVRHLRYDGKPNDLEKLRATYNLLLRSHISATFRNDLEYCKEHYLDLVGSFSSQSENRSRFNDARDKLVSDMQIELDNY